MSDKIDLYKKMHENEKRFPGESLRQHAPMIVRLIELYNAKSLLDYGCGKGKQYSRDKIHVNYFKGIMPALYDPAVPAYETLPEGVYDGVISTDVMEHIPDEALDETFNNIYSKAGKFVYLGICTVPAHTILPNGENAHCTVHGLDWWIDRIKPFAKVPTTILCYGKGTEMYSIT